MPALAAAEAAVARWGISRPNCSVCIARHDRTRFFYICRTNKLSVLQGTMIQHGACSGELQLVKTVKPGSWKLSYGALKQFVMYKACEDARVVICCSPLSVA